MNTTIGQLLINNTLPPDMRDYDRVLDKKGINRLLSEVATKHPEQYREVSKNLADVGWQVAQETGGYSLGLQHLTKSRYARKMGQQMQTQIDQLLDDDSLDDKKRDAAIVKLAGSKLKEQQDQVYEESLAEKNPLALQILSGARGSKMNLASLRGSDLLYVDHRDRPIPVPILRSYSEGLTPAEYFSSTYGARKGVYDLKNATRRAGYFSKQLSQVSHRLVVEGLDKSPTPDDENRGLPVDTEDKDNEGALLARTTGPYKRNTPLTPQILRHLSQTGVKRILVRSPLLGGSVRGGVYSRDVGVREHGTLPGIGELPGLAAAQSLSEPITQSQLQSKHVGGVSGGGQAVSGFDWINSLVNVPKHVEGGATHAENDGTVGRIDDAPAGGRHVFIDGKKHYTAADSDLLVGVGDQVEAGDAISHGVPSPAKVVEHKGIGEGRRYFVKSFKEAMGQAGISVNRRNVELLSRGLINHVRLTDEMGDYVSGDVVPYSTMEHLYQPREDAKTSSPEMAHGKYLEKPVLHYTIGTPIKKSVIKELNDFGIKEIVTHEAPPPFKAEMIRGTASLSYDPDWMTQMYGSGLKGNLLEATHRGAISDESGSSFVPSLAKSVGFGRSGIVHKPEPGYRAKGFDPVVPSVQEQP